MRHDILALKKLFFSCNFHFSHARDFVNLFKIKEYLCLKAIFTEVVLLVKPEHFVGSENLGNW